MARHHTEISQMIIGYIESPNSITVVNAIGTNLVKPVPALALKHLNYINSATAISLAVQGISAK